LTDRHRTSLGSLAQAQCRCQIAAGTVATYDDARALRLQMGKRSLYIIQLRRMRVLGR
jgi:hypothetical protein